MSYVHVARPPINFLCNEIFDGGEPTCWLWNSVMHCHTIKRYPRYSKGAARCTTYVGVVRRRSNIVPVERPRSCDAFCTIEYDRQEGSMWRVTSRWRWTSMWRPMGWWSLAGVVLHWSNSHTKPVCHDQNAPYLTNRTQTANRRVDSNVMNYGFWHMLRMVRDKLYPNHISKSKIHHVIVDASHESHMHVLQRHLL